MRAPLWPICAHPALPRSRVSLEGPFLGGREGEAEALDNEWLCLVPSRNRNAGARGHQQAS
eukprot:6778013-Alexandrium_andersonii.AAC.1